MPVAADSGLDADVVYALTPSARPYGQRGKYPKPPYPKAADGTHLCRWCNVSLGVKKQRWWCSKECLREFWSRADWKTIARTITERDKVCRLCGGGRYQVTPDQLEYEMGCGLIEGHPWVYWHHEARAGRYDARPRACPLQILWQVDHIVAVSEGGTDHPDNLRLLCGRCHGEVTAAQHSRWAAERRLARLGRPPDQVALL